MATSKRCPLCGAPGAICGKPTVSLPVDARVSGLIVAGNKLMPAVPNPPSDLTDEERDEYEMLSTAMAKRSLRNQIEEVRVQAMAEGKAPHTSLSYVECTDGVTRKMAPDIARQYVEMNEGSKIVREGALPVAREGEVISATKATSGEVFNADGTQKDDVQLLSSRTFHASDRTRVEAVNPPVSSAIVSSATGPAGPDTTAPKSTDGGTESTSLHAPKVTKPSGGKD